MTSNSFLKKFHNDGTKILKRYLNAKKFHNNGIKTVSAKKNSAMMILKNLKRFLNVTKKVPQ